MTSMPQIRQFSFFRVLCSRHNHSQKQARSSLGSSNKKNSKNQVQKRQIFGPLWEPFCKVIPDHAVDEHSTVIENGSEPEGSGEAARFYGIAPSEAYERAADTVTPLWRLDYDRQLAVKQARVRALLRQLAGQLGRPAAAPDGRRAAPLPCPLDRIVASPQIDGYRNKEEYKIGEGVDGDPKTVGFIFSSPARGPALCLPGDKLRNCKPEHARVALAFQDFLRTSPLPACSRLDDGGHWRLLLVRSSRAGRLLASATFHPQRLPAAGVEAERSRLRDFFLSGPGADCGLQSLCFQECQHARCTADQAPYQPLFGPAVLEDQIGDVRFLVSPDSFFQVNVPAAEELYQVVVRQARPTPATVLLDLCSGTGPVSLLMARHCRLCIGIEATASAVRDANENARINDIHNVEFVAGRIEKELPRLIGDLDLCSDMVAVVNPGRDGVSSRVIAELRAAGPLRRVVYIACKPDHQRTAANLAALCRPAAAADRTPPFRLSRASPVDLFPHTDHLELVLTFER